MQGVDGGRWGDGEAVVHTGVRGCKLSWWRVRCIMQHSPHLLMCGCQLQPLVHQRQHALIQVCLDSCHPLVKVGGLRGQQRHQQRRSLLVLAARLPGASTQGAQCGMERWCAEVDTRGRRGRRPMTNKTCHMWHYAALPGNKCHAGWVEMAQWVTWGHGWPQHGDAGRPRSTAV